MSISSRVPDDERYPEALKYKVSSGIWVQCDSCDDYSIWDNLPYENVLTGREHEMFWGAPCSYETVEGWICPECGHRNSF